MNKPRAIHGLAGTAIRVLTITAMLAGLVATGPSLVAPAQAAGETPGVAALSGASITVSPATPWAAPTTGGTRPLAVTSSVAWTLSGLPAWITSSAVKGTGNTLVTLTAQPNNTGVARSGSLVFTPTAGTAVTLSVTQAPVITPVSWSPATTGGSQVATIKTASAWSLTGLPAWVTATAVSGSGNGTVTLTATANTTGSARTGSIVLTTGGTTVTVTVKQAAIVTPIVWAAPPTGGTRSVTITTPVGWTLTGFPAWIKPSAVSGTGNATVTLTAQTNNTTAARKASLVFTTGGKTVTLAVTQAVVVFAVSPASWTVPTIGGSQVVTVTSPAGWTLTGLPAWVTVTSVKGTGSGTVTLTATTNGTGAARSGSLVFTPTSGTAVKFPVSQAPVVTPVSWTAPTTHGSQVVTVSTTGAWTLTGLPSWVMASAVSGTGNGTVTLYVHTNSSGAARTASFVLTTGGKSVTLTVKQSPFVTPVMWTPPAIGGTQVLTVTTPGMWTMTGLPAWMTATAVNGTGNSTVTLTATANTTGGTRIANMGFTNNNENQMINLSVVQSPIVTPLSWSPRPDSTSTVVTVTTPVAWNLTGLPAWITASAVSGTGNATVTLTTQANNTTAARTASLVVATGGKTVKITVNQPAYTITVSPTSWAVPAGGGSTTMKIVSNAVPSGFQTPYWIKIKTTQISGYPYEVTYNLTAEANNTAEARTYSIVVTAGPKQATLTVTQPIDPTISISDATWDTIWAGSTMRTWVSSNTDWQAKFPAWITVTPASGKAGGAWVTVGTLDNNTAGPRTGTVTFSVTGKQATLTVKQGEPTLAVSESSWQAPIGGEDRWIVVAGVTAWSLVTPLPTWITASRTSGPGGKTDVLLHTAANTTGASRTGTVSFKSGDKLATVTVKQYGETISVSPTSWAAPGTGGTQTVKVTTTVPWEVTGIPFWMTVTPASGNGNTTVTLTVTANTGADARTWTLWFSIPGMQTKFTVTQAVRVDDCGATASAACTWANLATSVNGRIEVPGDRDWYKITPAVSGTWTFKSSILTTGGTPNPLGMLHTADGAMLIWDSVRDGHPQFVLTANLVAGTTYYLEVSDMDISSTGAYSVTAVRTT